MNFSTQSLIKNNSLPNGVVRLWADSQRKISVLVKKVKEESAVVYWTAIAVSVIGLVCVFGIFIDNRTLMGVNVWVKPLKFSISITIYLISAGYLITKYPYSKKKKALINHITAWSLLFEFLIIVYQASRGVQSHYNTATALDGILFMLMGVFVGINVFIMFLFIVDTARLKLKTTKAIQWAIFLGWVIVVFGSWVGGQMISQMAHNVATADGGAGLPLVNWSTEGGDLRIAHFFALHSIQIIPLFALWVSKKRKLSERNQILLISIFGLLFALGIGFVFYQAKQGIPLIVL
ncbi:hypothetical protein ACFQZJ_13230 [Maribacter chungangensis]|uniref:Uncharacterized protein n=1 Tax=Maribacter chungangensis TaxID=1069117 RepID=A0ABW3B608_9FLAO